MRSNKKRALAVKDDKHAIGGDASQMLRVHLLSTAGRHVTDRTYFHGKIAERILPLRAVH